MTAVTIPTLETERLRLRAPKRSDFNAYAAFRASERARHVFGPNPRHIAWNQFCAISGQWQLLGYGRWIIADKDTDEPLGLSGIFHPIEWPEPEIAWSVFENGEGRGIAFEAAQEVRRYAYEDLGWTRIISVVHPENIRSVALAERLGCRKVGEFEHETYGTMPIWLHPTPEELGFSPAPRPQTAPHEQPATGPAAAFAKALQSELPELTTARLRLRAPRIEDFEVYAEIATGPEGRFITEDPSRESAWYDFAQVTAAWLLRGHGVWTVEPKDGGEVLGFVLLGFEPGDHEPELGYLFRENARGQGYATEAADIARVHAFLSLGLPTLVSTVDHENVASCRLAERLGATRDPAAEAAHGHVIRVYRYPSEVLA